MNNKRLSEIHYWIITIIILTLHNLTTPTYNPDTYYYVDAINRIFNGIPDCLRTPTYPIILWIFNVNNSDTTSAGVTVFQSLIYLISVYSFKNICESTIKNKTLSKSVRYVYILFFFPSWCNELITESLCISGIIILIDLIIQTINKPKLGKSILSTILLTVLYFLRPTFVIFIIFLPIYYLYIWHKTKAKEYLTNICLIIIPLSFLILYCYSFNQQYGSFSSSITSECNTIDHLKESKMWNPKIVIDEKAYSAIMHFDKNVYGDYSGLFCYVSGNGNVDLIDKACKNMINADKKQFIRQKIGNFYRSTGGFFISWNDRHSDTLSSILCFFGRFFSFPLNIFYIFALTSPLALLFDYKRSKSLDFKQTLIIAILFSYTVGIVYAALNSHSRLLAPVLPLFLVYTAYLFENKVIPVFKK